LDKLALTGYSRLDHNYSSYSILVNHASIFTLKR
jgi:hypothetical protein